MNRIHIISGIAIVTVALLLGTATIMSDQQSAFAHGYYYDHHNNNHRHGNDGSAAAAEQQLAIAQPQEQQLVAVQHLDGSSGDSAVQLQAAAGGR